MPHLTSLLQNIALPVREVYARQHDVVHCKVIRCAVLGSTHVTQVFAWDSNLPLDEFEKHLLYANMLLESTHNRLCEVLCVIFYAVTSVNLGFQLDRL